MLQEVCHSKVSSNRVLTKDNRRQGVAKKADLQVQWGEHSRIICEHKRDNAKPVEIAMDKVKLGQMARDQVRAMGKDPDAMGEAHLLQAEADITRYLQNPAANAPKFIAPGWGTRPRSRYPLSPGPPLGGGN